MAVYTLFQVSIWHAFLPLVSVSLFSGVNSFDEMLESNVVECSENALLSGVKVGMKGEEVLKYIK